MVHLTCIRNPTDQSNEGYSIHINQTPEEMEKVSQRRYQGRAQTYSFLT